MEDWISHQELYATFSCTQESRSSQEVNRMSMAELCRRGCCTGHDDRVQWGVQPPVFQDPSLLATDNIAKLVVASKQSDRVHSLLARNNSHIEKVK